MVSKLRIPYVVVNEDDNMYSFQFNKKFYSGVYQDSSKTYGFLLKNGIVHACYVMYLHYKDEYNLPKIIVRKTEGGYFYYEYEFNGAVVKQRCEGDYKETFKQGAFKLITECGYFKGLK